MYFAYHLSLTIIGTSILLGILHYVTKMLAVIGAMYYVFSLCHLTRNDNRGSLLCILHYVT